MICVYKMYLDHTQHSFLPPLPLVISSSQHHVLLLYSFVCWFNPLSPISVSHLCADVESFNREWGTLFVATLLKEINSPSTYSHQLPISP